MTVALRIRGVTKIQIIGGTRGDGATKVGRVAVKGGSRDAHLGVTAKVDGTAAVVNARRRVTDEGAIGHLKAVIDGHGAAEEALVARERRAHELQRIGNVENGRNGAAGQGGRVVGEFGVVYLELTVAVEEGAAVFGGSVLREDGVMDDEGRAVVVGDSTAADGRIFLKAAVFNKERALVVDVDGAALGGGLVLREYVTLGRKDGTLDVDGTARSAGIALVDVPLGQNGAVILRKGHLVHESDRAAEIGGVALERGGGDSVSKGLSLCAAVLPERHGPAGVGAGVVLEVAAGDRDARLGKNVRAARSIGVVEIRHDAIAGNALSARLLARSRDGENTVFGTVDQTFACCLADEFGPVPAQERTRLRRIGGHGAARHERGDRSSDHSLRALGLHGGRQFVDDHQGATRLAEHNFETLVHFFLTMMKLRCRKRRRARRRIKVHRTEGGNPLFDSLEP